jgi:CRISPR locus-related DNA-binding protein
MKTMQPMTVKLRVHISPVGFEFLRVTKPLIDLKAEKVYLVCYQPEDAAKKYLKMIKDELRQKYPHIIVKDVFVNLWDLYDCVGKFREIIDTEKGNEVYINVSSGTKITAIAGMIVCMMTEAVPYYSGVSFEHSRKIEEYETEYVQGTDFLPVYSMNKPDKNMMFILDLLQKNDSKMKKSKIIDELKKNDTIKIKDEKKKFLTKSAEHSQLRAILDPMEVHWKFIKVEARGRLSEVSLTDKGKAALKIFGV